jgi:hypothetical protein
LRREHFTIFKKGAKGISYVCAVKRKFRIPGQTFAESIGALIAFIEAHPMMRAGELVNKYLGVVESPEASAKAGEGAATGIAPVDGAAPKAEAPRAPSNLLTLEQREKIARMQGDLLWLVREGYVTEFIDGSLYASPPMVEARKKEVESEDHDPENFPEPTRDTAAESVVASAPVSTPEPVAEASVESTPAVPYESPPIPAVDPSADQGSGPIREPVGEPAPSSESHPAPLPEPPVDPVIAT